ncbi:cysteine protease ATG4C isoform X2 [Electrophorus electricus]|nr:cysteine protease ATG4C isoform X2 [Electrophorus electricus]
MDGDSVLGNVDGFRSDFASRVWLTYREELAPLPGSTLTSDCGWGCTLRAGQMMLAQALLLHFLGREWIWPGALRLEPMDTETRTSSAARRLVASLESSFQGERPRASQPLYQCPGGAEEADAHLKEVYHRTIVTWFGDTPSAQLGVHRLVHLGMTSGKRVGDWYGPAVVAHILRKAVEEATDPGLRGVNVYVAQDCTVYSADVVEKHSARADALRGPEGSPADSTAVIILIPIRLGGEKINPDYFNFVKGILSLEYCIGIIGGKPKQAYYFVGFQDDSLIYMDPHYCQSFVDVSKSDFPLQSYHCPSPKKMPFIKMDPSCTIGFYSRSVQDYERISNELSKVLQPSPKEKYPAFTFMKGHGRDYELSVPVEKREWPFIQSTQKAGASAGDFVLL